MADNLKNRGQQDRSRVNPGENWEMNYMREKTGASTQEIEAAVKAVGNDRDKVEQYLSKKK